MRASNLHRSPRESRKQHGFPRLHMLVGFLSVFSVLITGSSFTSSSSTALTCRRTDSPSTTLRRSCILRFGLEHLESASSSSTSRCYRFQALEQKKNYTTSLCYVARTLTYRGSDEEKVHILHPLPNIYISAAWPSPSLLLTNLDTFNQPRRCNRFCGAEQRRSRTLARRSRRTPCCRFAFWSLNLSYLDGPPQS